MSTIISFENVHKHFPLYHHLTGGIKNFIFNFPKALTGLKSHRFTALNGISFSIKKGESVAIIGKNGSGKSTTLGLIAQVLKPNSGNVYVNGRVSPLLELGGGFHPDLTGIDNIKLNGVLLGLTSKQVNSKLNDIVEFSELGDFINQPVRTFSSGMMARLGFSVVANLDPEILLIDEVLGVGDLSFQEKCVNKMLEFKEQGVTIILVTHSPGEVEKICDRCIWIHEKKIIKDGSSKEILEQYRRMHLEKIIKI